MRRSCSDLGAGVAGQRSSALATQGSSWPWLLPRLLPHRADMSHLHGDHLLASAASGARCLQGKWAELPRVKVLLLIEMTQPWPMAQRRKLWKRRGWAGVLIHLLVLLGGDAASAQHFSTAVRLTGFT